MSLDRHFDFEQAIWRNWYPVDASADVEQPPKTVFFLVKSTGFVFFTIYWTWW